MNDDTARGSAQSGDQSTTSRTNGPDEERPAMSAAVRRWFDERTTIPERSRATGGTVYLVGAGPGDPDLLTVRARRLIETADVVLHDALTRDTLVDRIPTLAEAVDVGKRAEHETPQSEINDLLVDHASSETTASATTGTASVRTGRSASTVTSTPRAAPSTPSSRGKDGRASPYRKRIYEPGVYSRP